MPANLYTQMFKYAFDKQIDWDSDDIKCMLLASTYTFDQDGHDTVSDVVAHEVSGTGYTAGGKSLTNKSLTVDNDTNTVVLDADDVVWDNASVTARYAVLYNASAGTQETMPLIGCVTFASDEQSANAPFAVRWESSGIIRLTAN